MGKNFDIKVKFEKIPIFSGKYDTVEEMSKAVKKLKVKFE